MRLRCSRRRHEAPREPRESPLELGPMAFDNRQNSYFTYAMRFRVSVFGFGLAALSVALALSGNAFAQTQVPPPPFLPPALQPSARPAAQPSSQSTNGPETISLFGGLVKAVRVDDLPADPKYKLN